MNRTDIKAFSFSIVLDLILCAVLLTGLARAGSSRSKGSETSSPAVYSEANTETGAFENDPSREAPGEDGDESCGEGTIAEN